MLVAVAVVRPLLAVAFLILAAVALLLFADAGLVSPVSSSRSPALVEAVCVIRLLSTSSLDPEWSALPSSPPTPVPVPDAEKESSPSMPTSMPTWREVGSWSVALEATLPEDVENAETLRNDEDEPDEDEDEPAAARKKLLLALARPRIRILCNIVESTQNL